MNKIIGVIVVLAVIWFVNKDSNEGVYDVNGDPTVIVFTIDQCKDLCKEVITDLTNRRVPFNELMIDPSLQNDENVELWNKLGRGGFPFIVAGEEQVVGNSKAQLASLLGLIFDQKYLTSIEKKYYKNHFYSDGKPKIVLYGTDWCKFCAKLRKDFKNENMDYADIDVESARSKKELMGTLEIGGYPAVWVGYKRLRRTGIEDVKDAVDEI